MSVKLRSNSICFLMIVWMISGQCFSKDHIESSKVDSGARSLLLMSDIHFDPFADPQLVKSLIEAPVEQWEGLLASVPNEFFSPYGKDSNYALMVSALTAARDRGPYKLAIITGDYLVHDSRKLFEPFGGKDELAYESFVIKTEIFVAREVQKQLGNTPVYFSLGNNDSECGDYMMATHTKFLKALSAEWKVLKDQPEAQKTMAEAGYYEAPHPILDDTQLVVLNDIYWSNRYEADSCYSQPNDKAGDKEMEWLKSCLSKAASAKRKVILVMHIPPQVDIFGTMKAMTSDKKKSGKLFWEKKYEKAFVNLVRDYPGAVEFAYAGHTHMDDFRVLSDRQGKPFLVTHLCPAVSPIRMNNPSFQLVRFDKSTGEVRDIYTYYLKNLASARGTNGQWGMEYDFGSTYGLEAYNADTLKALTDQFDTDSAKLSLFAKYYIVSAPEVVSAEAWKTLNPLRLLVDEKELKSSLKK